MTQKIIARFLSVFIVAAFAGMVISGCSSTTTTPPTTTTTTVTPKAGSTYTYHKHEVDSTSGKASVTTDSTIIAAVVSSGVPFVGKTNVVTLNDDFDTLRYEIESSNDVSIYRDHFGANGFVFINHTPWMLLPFGSKNAGVALFAFDTTIAVQGVSVPFHVIGTADYIGTDEVDTNAKKLASGGQVKVTITITGTAAGTTLNIVSTQTYSFDPTIGGYFHSISNTTIPDLSVFGQHVITGSTSVTTKTLTNYNLK